MCMHYVKIDIACVNNVDDEFVLMKDFGEINVDIICIENGKHKEDWH
jgi:hypothetical protein